MAGWLHHGAGSLAPTRESVIANSGLLRVRCRNAVALDNTACAEGAEREAYCRCSAWVSPSGASHLTPRTSVTNHKAPPKLETEEILAALTPTSPDDLRRFIKSLSGLTQGS